MRAVVTVATGSYMRGAKRLQSAINGDAQFFGWFDIMPPGSPSHRDIPYAFKAHALKAAADAGATTLLWADASILPIRPLAPLFERIEQDGYWISRNGFTNHQWTCNAAYADLGVTQEENKGIEHVVATAFGVDLTKEIGRYIFGEYLRLAKTRAFCGPWEGGVGVQHRHDQTALSVVAHRAGCVLTSAPEWFAYRDKDREPSPATILLADSTY